MRIIEKARLVGVGVVDDPQYPQSLVQARAKELRAKSGRTLRARIPSSTKLACQCSGAGCKFAEFAQGAVDEMLDNAIDRAANTIAAWENYQSPLASVGKRTLRRSGDDGIEIDIPTGAAGDAVLEAHENAGIIVRPFLDAAESVGAVEGDVMAYSSAKARAFIVSATDQRAGWPTPQLIPTPEAVREAPRPRERMARLWL